MSSGRVLQHLTNTPRSSHPKFLPDALLQRCHLGALGDPARLRDLWGREFIPKQAPRSWDVRIKTAELPELSSIALGVAAHSSDRMELLSRRFRQFEINAEVSVA